jgi:hypothetical protein
LGAQTWHRGIGMKESACDVTGLERGELDGGRRFGEFQPDSRMVLMKFAQNPWQDCRHGESR